MYLLSPKHDSEILFSSKGEPLSNIKIHIPHIPDIPHRKVAKLKSEKCGKRESGKNSFLTKSMVNKV